MEVLRFLRRQAHGNHSIIFPAVGFVVTLLIWCPGATSSDSRSQINQALTGSFEDWHPVVLAWIWSLLLKIWDSQLILLIFNLVIFWYAIFKLLNSKADLNRFRFIFMIMVLFPWILNFQGVLWKDVVLANTLLLMFALLSKEHLSKIENLLFILLFIFSINIRWNAFPALIPPIYFWLKLNFSNSKKLFLLAISSLAIIVSVTVGLFFSYSVLDSKKTHPENVTIINDLVYFSYSSGTSLIPEVSKQEIENCQEKKVNGVNYMYRYSCFSESTEISFRNNSRELRSVWLSQIKSNPEKWFMLKTKSFLHFLNFSGLPPQGVAFSGNYLSPFETSNPSFGQQLVSGYAVAVSILFPFLFRPGFWFILIIFLILVFTRTNFKTSSLNLAVLSSAFLYLTAYFPIVQGPDFRYVYWPVLGATFVIINHFTYRPPRIFRRWPWI